MNLQAIKDRYFRPVIANSKGMVTHHGHCHLYRAIEVYKFAFCSCGLLHDLGWLGGSLAEKIYPNYVKDCKRQDNPNGLEPTQEEMNELQNMLEKTFKFTPMTEEEKIKQDKEEWELIADVFGK